MHVLVKIGWIHAAPAIACSTFKVLRLKWQAWIWRTAADLDLDPVCIASPTQASMLASMLRQRACATRRVSTALPFAVHELPTKAPMRTLQALRFSGFPEIRGVTTVFPVCLQAARPKTTLIMGPPGGAVPRCVRCPFQYLFRRLDNFVSTLCMRHALAEGPSWPKCVNETNVRATEPSVLQEYLSARLSGTRNISEHPNMFPIFCTGVRMESSQKNLLSISTNHGATENRQTAARTEMEPTNRNEHVARKSSFGES